MEERWSTQYQQLQQTLNQVRLEWHLCKELIKRTFNVCVDWGVAKWRPDLWLGG
jgi:hypothetical protein